MSKIDELIKKYCPDGVEYKKLGDVSFLITKGTTPKTFDKEGICFIKTEAFNGSKINKDKLSFINKDIHEKELKRSILQKDDILFAIAGSIGKCVVVTEDILPANTNQALAIIRLTKKVNMKYILYILQSEKMENYIELCVKGSAQPNLNLQQMNDFVFPFPPLEVQEEIARIFEKFSHLTAELEAELEKRKQQYEYYRDELLNFSENAATVHGAIYYEKLGELIISLKTGLNPRKNFVLNDENAENYYVTVREIINGKIIFLNKTDKVNDYALKLINNRSNLEVGDILFSGTGTIGRTAVINEMPLNWNIKEGVYVIKPIKSKINSKFLLYILNTSHIVNDYKKKVVGSPVASLPMAELRKLLIPIPSLEEQERIVYILDKFDTLTNDLQWGLPAEIEKRKQQYEYYRNKLLTFKEATV